MPKKINNLLQQTDGGKWIDGEKVDVYPEDAEPEYEPDLQAEKFNT